MIRNTWMRVAAALLLMAGLLSQAQAQSFTEGFGDISTLAGSGWVRTNASVPVGEFEWFQGVGSAGGDGGIFDAYNGETHTYIAANFNSTGNTGTISNWLMTPSRTFRNGDVLTFFTRKADPDSFADRLEVRLSTNGAGTDVGAGETVGDYTTLLLSVNPSLDLGVYPTTWTQYTITLSGLPAPTSGRMAFRYFVTDGGLNGTASDYMGIDNVVYTSYVCPAFTLAPAAGALTHGFVGQAYNTSLGQTGALGTPTYAVTAGALPPGLTISASGTISGTPTATGTSNFTVTVNDASECSGSQSYSITVNKVAQTITFPAQTPASRVFAQGGSFALNPVATASSALVVTYTGSPSSVCTVSGTTVAMQGPGVCTIAADQAGNDNYSAAAQQTQSVTIDKIAQTITFTSAAPANPQVAGTYTVAATGGQSGNTVVFAINAASASVCSISGTTVTFDAAGVCTVNANQPGNATYSDAAQAQQTMTVAATQPTVAITSNRNSVLPNQPVTFTVSVAANTIQSAALRLQAAAVPTGTVEITDGGTSLGTAPLVNGSATITTTQLTTVGTHSLVASYSGDANYAAASSAAFAQVVVAGEAKPVPTLSQWALMLLAAALAGFAALRLRRVQ